MKMFLKPALAALVLAAPSMAFATDYAIDPGHTSANFAVKHMMVSTVRGAFSKVTGNVSLDEKDLTKSSIDASIDATTVNTNEPKRDEHLRSAEFLDTAKYPTITFKSTKIAKAGKGFKVTGDFTLHGVTKPVTLDVEGFTTESKDPWGNFRRGGSATTKINRKDFGLSWNSAVETGGVVVGDEVTITIDLELTKKQDAAAAPAAKETAPAKK